MQCPLITDVDAARLTDADYRRVRLAVPEHGVICLRNQTLDLDALVALTRRLGEPVLLPEALRFNNTHVEFPEVARVSNILPDGSLLPDHSAAEYWHSDGDFWQPGRNYLFNLLYSEIVPTHGGATGFADLRLAWQSLDASVQAALVGRQVIVSCSEIPDFRNTRPEERQPDARHFVKHQHAETGRTGLYFGHCLARIAGIPVDESDALLGEMVKAIERPENQYQHQWMAGDLLIWDNTSVMHRSMGGYGNSPRLLFRTQAFINPLTRPRDVASQRVRHATPA